MLSRRLSCVGHQIQSCVDSGPVTGWGPSEMLVSSAWLLTQVPELVALRPGEQVEGLLYRGAPQGEQITDALQLGALLPGRAPAAIVWTLQYHGGHALQDLQTGCVAVEA